MIQRILGLAKRRYLLSVRPRVARAYAYFSHLTYGRVFAGPLRDMKPDIIHAHDGVTLPVAARVARETGAKLVFDSHELESHRNPPLSLPRRLQVEGLERRHLKRADRVVTVGHRIADYLETKFGIDRPEVVFNAPPAIPGAVPARWDVQDRFSVREDCMLRPKDFVFAYTGNITANRGLELALIALSRLQGFADPNGRFGGSYHLVAIGKVQGEQDEVLRRVADRYGMRSRFHIVPPVAPHKVVSYIGTADASLIPVIPAALSYELAMPNKLFEAMLSGNPIVASDLMEMRETIAEERLGLTYRADDPDHCAETMMELVRRYPQFHRPPSRQRELGRRYAWEAQEQKLYQLYEGL